MDGLGFYPNIYFVVSSFIKKNIYILDDGLIFGKNTTKNIVNNQSYRIINYPRNESNIDDPLFTLKLRQSNEIQVKYTRRKRLYTVILEMISMATTLLANFKAIGSILNLKKAKQKVFKEVFHINSDEKEEEIKMLK